VHGARLHQHVHVAESPSVVGREPPSGSEQPPYPFKSGDSLLNLTRVHNVRLILSCSLDGLLPYKFEMNMISSLAHNLAIRKTSRHGVFGLDLQLVIKMHANFLGRR
jgi:hypothetical protein